MDEIARFDEGNDCFEVISLEREVIPKAGMKPDIRLHLAELPFSIIISIFGEFGA